MKQINEVIKTYLEACEHEMELSPHTVRAYRTRHYTVVIKPALSD